MPDAQVAGQSANPVVGMETAELLQHETARRVLGSAGGADTEGIEWRAGPERLDGEGGGLRPLSVSLLGDEVELETFGGVVGEDRVTAAVTMHIARTTQDDHVIAAGVNPWPAPADSDVGLFGDSSTVARTRGLTAHAVERLTLEE
ncbi:MAG: DUF6517 family protein [Natrialbaceae archaeon]|nr:DUF6517 family protein [Natrialbaceae archaeon]